MSLDKLRKSARLLRRSVEVGAPEALARLRQHPPRAAGVTLRHGDYLHVIAQEQGFASWPALKLAAELSGLDRARQQQRLKIALFHGQNRVVEQLLQQVPDLAQGVLGLQIALYDLDAVKAALLADPGAACRALGPRTPMLHLAFSRYIQQRPDLAPDMLAIAELLLAHGAGVNEAMTAPDGSALSALYGALGHADNMVLAQWLLDHGADPDDGESLYHATELGHHRGLQMLLKAGANPAGTNALLRALDFNDHVAIEALLAAGGDVRAFHAEPQGGEPPLVIPALHQAARRMCDAQMGRLLLQAGADPARPYQGVSAYGYARVFGNKAIADLLAPHGAELSPLEQQLAGVAAGQGQGALVVKQLPPAYRDLLAELLRFPEKLPHVKRLVAAGLDYDQPDAMGLTPVQLAAWEGLPEALAFFLSLKPDLDHVNAYGGTLLSTLIHGSENCRERRKRDHLACLQQLLELGIAIPVRAADMAGDVDMAELLLDWGQSHPEQLMQGGVV